MSVQLQMATSVVLPQAVLIQPLHCFLLRFSAYKVELLIMVEEY